MITPISKQKNILLLKKRGLFGVPFGFPGPCSFSCMTNKPSSALRSWLFFLCIGVWCHFEFCLANLGPFYMIRLIVLWYVMKAKWATWDMLSQSIHTLLPYITFGMQFSWPKYEQLMMLKLPQSYNKNLPNKR